jgi:hypothetical protein
VLFEHKLLSLQANNPTLKYAQMPTLFAKWSNPKSIQLFHYHSHGSTTYAVQILLTKEGFLHLLSGEKMGSQKLKFSHHQTLPLDSKKILETSVLLHTHDQTQNP